MDFYRETGAIISPNKQILHLVDGTAGLTIFPQQVLWDLHRNNPGQVFAISHIHPPHMENLSHEDETTLKAWAMAFYPWPMRMITISEYAETNLFVETCHLGIFESKELWQFGNLLRSDGKKNLRKFEIIRDWHIYHERHYDEHLEENESPWYGDVLIQRSYK